MKGIDQLKEAVCVGIGMYYGGNTVMSIEGVLYFEGQGQGGKEELKRIWKSWVWGDCLSVEMVRKDLSYGSKKICGEMRLLES